MLLARQAQIEADELGAEGIVSEVTGILDGIGSELIENGW